MIDTQHRTATAFRGHLCAAPEPAEVYELPGRLDSPDVSVIVPSFNRRALLLEMLEALARQEGPSFEAVIVDDGSSDETFDAVVRSAADLGLAGRVLRLPQNGGPAPARNAGVLAARADVLAFTDSDCLPAAGWLEAGTAALTVGVSAVQGRTCPPPGSRPPFFSHFMHIERLDGTFSTCNIFYRREALVQAGGFDPACDYCEDLDLGWRVLAAGHRAVYAPDALVHHQVIRQTPAQWLRWPARAGTWPRCIARHPQGRRYLFARYWLNPAHAALTLAIAGLLAAPAYRPLAAAALPYLVSVPLRHGFKGKAAPAKTALYIWWDIAGWVSAAAASLRNRTVVL